MAQEEYGFFDSSGEDIRSYNSVDMARAFYALVSSGVSVLGTNLEVTAEGANMRTVVGYGRGMILGRFYELVDDGNGVKAFTHSTEASLNRIDRIVLKLDLTARTVTLVKKIGAAASTPAVPTLTRSSEVWELSLAQVLITAGSAIIEAEDITDERDDDTVCGLIAPEALRPSAVEAAIAAAILLSNADVLRKIAQTFTDPEKLQIRTNIAAQVAITIAGILKRAENGTFTAAIAGVDFAPPVVEVAGTLTAVGWTGASAPYTQNVSIAGMTATRLGVSVGLSPAATDAQFDSALDALLMPSAQGTSFITVKAHGDKPLVDIPILVQMAG